MFAKAKKLSIVSVMLVLAMINAAFAAEVQPFASSTFRKHDATIVSTSSGLVLNCSVSTYTSKNQLGVSTFTLYDQTAGSNVTYGAYSYTQGMQFSDAIKITKTVKGHTYYAKVTFYADGSTYSQVTNSVRA